jgi:outer membrane protein assembly factor BamE (lipoprotein component of BamABCDE complex)
MKAKLGRTIVYRAAGLASLAVLALPATAGAAIVPGRELAGVRLGDSATRVTAVLGKPATVQTYKGGQSWFYGKGPVYCGGLP